jgi:hypothetical protein
VQRQRGVSGFGTVAVWEERSKHKSGADLRSLPKQNLEGNEKIGVSSVRVENVPAKVRCHRGVSDVGTVEVWRTQKPWGSKAAPQKQRAKKRTKGSLRFYATNKRRRPKRKFNSVSQFFIRFVIFGHFFYIIFKSLI